MATRRRVPASPWCRRRARFNDTLPVHVHVENNARSAALIRIAAYATIALKTAIPAESGPFLPSLACAQASTLPSRLRRDRRATL